MPVTYHLTPDAQSDLIGIHRFTLAQWGTTQSKTGEFKHEVRQFQKPYDNQQAEQISLMV